MAIYDAKHPDYERFQDKWKNMTLSFAGEDEIKAAGETYLPRPGGFSVQAEYDAYLKRASYPEIVAPTIRGLVGTIHSKDSTYELPPALEGMIERASYDGAGLETLHRRITHNLLLKGRYGLFADVDEKGEPYIAGYDALSIFNWDQDGDNVDFLTLSENGSVRNPETADWRERDVSLVYEIKDGRLDRRRFVDGIEDISGEDEEGASGTPTIDLIPFVFAGANDLTPAPDEIPSYGLSKVAVAIYQLDADYRKTLFHTAQPQPVAIGLEGQDAPMTYGNGLWLLPLGGDAKVLEFAGTGAEAQRQAIMDKRSEAVQLGARLFESQESGQESGDAKELRYAMQTTSLNSIATMSAAALEKALQYCLRWIDPAQDPDQVSVTPNLEFLHRNLTPEEISSLVKGWQAQAYSHETLYENLQKGGVANTERSFEEELLLIGPEDDSAEDIEAATGVVAP